MRQAYDYWQDQPGNYLEGRANGPTRKRALPRRSRCCLLKLFIVSPRIHRVLSVFHETEKRACGRVKDRPRRCSAPRSNPQATVCRVFNRSFLGQKPKPTGVGAVAVFFFHGERRKTTRAKRVGPGWPLPWVAPRRARRSEERVHPQASPQLGSGLRLLKRESIHLIPQRLVGGDAVEGAMPASALFVQDPV